MNKPNVAKMVKGVKSAVSKRSPEILMGLGIAGMITTTVLAVKATPKALQKIDEAKEEKGELKPIEVVKVAWKPYIPAAVTGIVSTACLIGSSSVSTRRNAALATAYQLSTTALSEYKEKVVETIGEKKEQVIREKIAEDKIAKNPVTNNTVFVTEKGSTLCYDSVSGRYFTSDIDYIKKVTNELNRRMLTEMYVSLNDFYRELDLPELPDIKIGDDLGWTTDAWIQPDFTAMLTDDNRPCIVMDFLVGPRYGYDNLY